MSLPDVKALKKIADACRKAGIKHYKCQDFEFTLTDEAPVSNYKKRQTKQETYESTPALDPSLNSESLTDDQLLFWSSADLANESGESLGN